MGPMPFRTTPCRTASSWVIPPRKICLSLAWDFNKCGILEGEKQSVDNIYKANKNSEMETKMEQLGLLPKLILSWSWLYMWLPFFKIPIKYLEDPLSTSTGKSMVTTNMFNKFNWKSLSQYTLWRITHPFRPSTMFFTLIRYHQASQLRMWGQWPAHLDHSKWSANGMLGGLGFESGYP